MSNEYQDFIDGFKRLAKIATDDQLNQIYLNQSQQGARDEINELLACLASEELINRGIKLSDKPTDKDSGGEHA